MEFKPIINTHENLKESIKSKVLNAIKNEIFPIETPHGRLEVHNVRIADKDYSLKDEKIAKLSNSTLSIPIKGDIILKDKDGKVLDTKKNAVIVKIPHLTNRNTFIISGHEYQLNNIMRMKPGVFLYKRGDDIKGFFNLAKGRNFHLEYWPEKQQFFVKYGTTSIPLMAVLESLGYDHEKITKEFGQDISSFIKPLNKRSLESHVRKLYEKLYPDFLREDLPLEEMKKAIKNHLENSIMDSRVNKNTIGIEHSQISPHVLIHTARKLLDLNKSGAQRYDDRDNIGYKRLTRADDFIKERLSFIAQKDIKNRLSKHIVSDPKIDKIMPSWLASDNLINFIQMTDLSELQHQYNPVSIADSRGKISLLGEGGIGDERAIPVGARQVHWSHLGVIDPIKTSESSHAGVDLRATVTAHTDEHGNLYAVLKNNKTGKTEHVPNIDFNKYNIAFYEGKHGEEVVDALIKGHPGRIKFKETDYTVPSNITIYGEVVNLIPFRNSVDPNRALMGAKFFTQALQLKDPDPALVRPAYKGKDIHQIMAGVINTTSPVDGKVINIDSDYIYIKPLKSTKKEGASKDDIIKIPHVKNFPLNNESFISITPSVKIGDTVKAGQVVAHTKNTQDNVLRLGKNLRTAYINYYGLNSNDAIVISEEAAKKLTSVHVVPIKVPKTHESIFDKKKFVSVFYNKYPASFFEKLDTNGIIKIGSKVLPGEIIAATMEPYTLSTESQFLGKISKKMLKNYVDKSVIWDKNFEGEVIDIKEFPTHYSVVVRYEAPAQVGDKISGMYGNKGVISHIIPTEQMLRDEEGKPLEVLMTPAGIVSRINPAQIYEAALGKIAAKKGKKYLINIDDPNLDNHKFTMEELKKHGIKDKENLYDPVTGKTIKNIFTGVSHIFKLFKTTDTNFSACGIGNYDHNDQPIQGGPSGAKAIGKMEFDALLSHNVKNLLNDIVIKGNKNDEFWRAIQLGHASIPAPKTPTAFNRFIHLLNALGIKVENTQDKFRFLPMSNKEILKMSSGEIKEPLMLNIKNFTPERGGLFDYNLTGGPSGGKFAHITLTTPVLNPMMEEVVMHLLGMTEKELHNFISEHGHEALRNKIRSIDINKIEKEILARHNSKQKLENKDIYLLKVIKNIKENNIVPHDHWFLKHVPVIPPVSRPVFPTQDGKLLISPLNYLYRDIIIANNNAKIPELPSKEKKVAEKILYDSVRALFGLGEPISAQAKTKNVKGVIEFLGGTRPKTGFFQSVVVYKPQVLSGRATAVPDSSLHMDKIKVPEDMLITMYSPFIVKRLVNKGKSPLEAQQLIEQKHPMVKQELLQEVQERPIIYNRAPSLHRFNIVAAYPIPTQGKTLKVPPFIESGMNLDYDGDTLQIHVPATPQAVQDAKKLLPSNLIFGDRFRGDLMMVPGHEAKWGVYEIQKAAQKANPKTFKFKTKEEALEAWKKGKIDLGDKVVIG